MFRRAQKTFSREADGTGQVAPTHPLVLVVTRDDDLRRSIEQMLPPAPHRLVHLVSASALAEHLTEAILHAGPPAVPAAIVADLRDHGFFLFEVLDALVRAGIGSTILAVVSPGDATARQHVARWRGHVIEPWTDEARTRMLLHSATRSDLPHTGRPKQA